MLVASDLDGTLLTKDGRLPEGTFDMIRELKEKGIAFAAASGRQYANMRRLFYPVRKDIYFICENGSLLCRGEEAPEAAYIGEENAREAIRDLLSLGMQLLLSTPECTYCLPGCRAFTDDMFYRLRNNMAVVEDPYLFAGDYIKISGFRADGVYGDVEPMREKWKGILHADAGGRDWLDLTPRDKADGLKALCRREGIPLSDVMAFGDQQNDVAMLQAAGEPYLMENAPEQVKAYGFPVCRSVPDKVRERLLQP